MVESNKFYATWTPRVLSVLRIITGFLFLWVGTEKFFNFPPDAWLIQVAAIMELSGGLLILVGLLTRPVAFLLSWSAYFLTHAPQGFLPLQNGSEAAVLYCFVFLFLSFAGGGDWSLDRLVWTEKKLSWKEKLCIS